MQRDEISTKSRLTRLAGLALFATAFALAGPAGGATPEAWRLLAIFVTVIVGFMVSPLPMGPMTLLGMVALVATHTVHAADVLKAYGEKVVWLVVAAYLLAGVLTRTGLGRRIALLAVVYLGRSTLGLGYALAVADLILAPVVPSNTARGGGILAPIMRSLASALGSEPETTPRLAGAFLALTGAHAAVITSGMFLTAMAANSILAKTASDLLHVDFDFHTWALGAAGPGLLSLALTPLLIYRLCPPGLKDSAPARDKAKMLLAEMGPPSWKEKVTFGVLTFLLGLWTTEFLHGIDSTTVAWIGVLVLLILGVETWRGITENAAAWDALIWVGGLLGLANLLNDMGLIALFAGAIKAQVTGLAPMTCLLILVLAYFYSMYGFSMLTAHISAMSATFIAVAGEANAPPMVTAALFAYFSDLCACLTHYSSGPVILYFGQGYVPVGEWLRVGAIVSILHLVVWIGGGMIWWRILGWW